LLNNRSKSFWYQNIVSDAVARDSNIAQQSQQIIWSKRPGQRYKSDDLFSQFSLRHKLDV
jgi:hypothetical protein